MCPRLCLLLPAIFTCLPAFAENQLGLASLSNISTQDQILSALSTNNDHKSEDASAEDNNAFSASGYSWSVPYDEMKEQCKKKRGDFSDCRSITSNRIFMGALTLHMASNLASNHLSPTELMPVTGEKGMIAWGVDSESAKAKSKGIERFLGRPRILRITRFVAIASGLHAFADKFRIREDRSDYEQTISQVEMGTPVDISRR